MGLPCTNIGTVMWLFAAATSLLTTRHLLEHRFHFPMHLLALQLTCALALRLVRHCFYRIGVRLELQPTQREPPWNNARIARRFLHTIGISGALLCSYQAILHLSNLPVVVMVLSLDWRTTETGTPSPPGVCKMQYVRRRLPLLVGVGMLVVFDFRPSITGIVLLALAAFFEALAHSLQPEIEATQNIESDCAQTVPISCAWTTELSSLDLLGALLSALFWCHFREQQFPDIRPYSPVTSDIPTLALNLACSGPILLIEGQPFRGLIYDSDERGRESSPKSEEHTFGRLSLSVALVCLATIGNVSLPTIISPLQLIGFAMASLATLPIDAWKLTCSAFIDLAIENSRHSEPSAKNKASSVVKSAKTRLSHRVFGLAVELIGWSCLALYILIPTSCMVLLQNALVAESSSGSLPLPVLDHSFRPAHAFDIVIARYDELPSEVARHITELVSLPIIQRLSPRITIYNKGVAANESSTFLPELQSLLSVDPAPHIVEHSLQNIGRESDTYLEHMSRYWDNLANHTLFIQASVHYAPWAYLRQIRDYFVPSTGFLSLSPSRSMCSSCDTCYDRDWTEEPSLINSIFKDFNHGAECKDVVLTYRGQFIASAARIRGNDRETYQRWLDALRIPQSALHTPPYIESAWSRKKDSMSAPRVGFTLERTWGVMLQCNQKNIAYRCPDFWSGLICPPVVCGTAALSDCQCLDY